MFKFFALLMQFSLIITDQPIKLLLIQGCSASGKSTLAKYAYDRLVDSKIDTVVLSVDNYYHTFPYELTPKNIEKYDFDNPAAINWFDLRDTVIAYSENATLVPDHKYDFSTKKNTKTMIKNIFPKVIIIEGILAFNIFNNSLINFLELDPMDSGKEISSDYMPNNLLDLSRFTIDPKLRLLLTISKDKLIETRLKRDKKSREVAYTNPLSDSLIEQRIISQIEKDVWPATEKWVYSFMNEPYVEIAGGTFDIECCEMVSREILHLLGAEKQQLFETYINEIVLDE